MVIADLDETGRVVAYVVATKAYFLTHHRDDRSKLFVDRSLFLNQADYSHFLNHCEKYGLKKGKFQRLDY